MKKNILLSIISMLIFMSTGCVTIGYKIPLDLAENIVINQTKREELEKQLGSPYRTGLDSGNPSATYLYYKMGLFRKPVTTDLTIVYNKQGTVKSYVFNTNEISDDQSEE